MRGCMVAFFAAISAGHEAPRSLSARPAKGRVSSKAVALESDVASDWMTELSLYCAMNAVGWDDCLRFAVDQLPKLCGRRVSSEAQPAVAICGKWPPLSL